MVLERGLWIHLELETANGQSSIEITPFKLTMEMVVKHMATIHTISIDKKQTFTISLTLEIPTLWTWSKKKFQVKQH